MTARRDINEVRARALYLETGSWNRTAKIMGVGVTTLRERMGVTPQQRAGGGRELDIPKFVHSPGGIAPDPLACSCRRYAPHAIYDPSRDGDPVYDSPVAEWLGDPPKGRRELLEANAARTEPKIGAPPTKPWRM